MHRQWSLKLQEIHLIRCIIIKPILTCSLINLTYSIGEQHCTPEIHLWDACTATPIKIFRNMHRNGVIGLCFSQSAEHLASIGTYSIVHYSIVHYTTLHYTTLHYTTLHYTSLHTVKHFTRTSSKHTVQYSVSHVQYSAVSYTYIKGLWRS